MTKWSSQKADLILSIIQNNIFGQEYVGLFLSVVVPPGQQPQRSGI